MTRCGKCGHEGDGAFCGRCGADLRGQEDPTSTSGTQRSAEHREGWQDEATYTGYQSYRSHPSGNPRQSAYRSGPVGSAPAAASAKNKNRRGNQMLGALVGVAAIAVFALVAYLVLRPGTGGGSSNAAPSVKNSPAATSSNSPASTQGGQPQQTVTETSTGGGNGGGANSGSGMSLDDVPGHVATNGSYAIGRSGSTLTVYNDPGSGAKAISTLTLNGSGDNSKLTMGALPGCKAPIIAWNSASARSSAAFGITSSGSYQMFKAVSGQYDMAPDGGDGSDGHSMGVYLAGSNLAFNDTSNAYDRTGDNNFDSCNSDGTTLHFSNKGDNG